MRIEPCNIEHCGGENVVVSLRSLLQHRTRFLRISCLLPPPARGRLCFRRCLFASLSASARTAMQGLLVEKIKQQKCQ